jgi:hypothetical protein
MLGKISRITLIVSASLLIFGCIALLAGWMSFLSLLPHLLALAGLLFTSWTSWLISAANQTPLAKTGVFLSVAGLLIWLLSVYGAIALKYGWMSATGCLFAGLAIAVFVRVSLLKTRIFTVSAVLLALLPVTIGFGLKQATLYSIGVYVLSLFSVLALLYSLQKRNQA